MDSKLKGKKLLVLGGTRISCEIIRKAQQMGIYVVVTDYNEVENSPGKKIADESFMVSATDVDEVVKLIKKECIDGVIVGFADVLLPYYAEICRKAGIPAYGTKEQFDVFINKDRYKELCRAFQVPTVEEYEVDLNDFEESTNQIKYPVMVKPADSSGARGITVCQSKKELKKALEKANSFSKSGKVLIERYLTGREVTVFWVFENGNYYLTAIGNRHVKKNQEGVIPLPVGYTFPASIITEYQEKIEQNVKNMLSSVGIENGMMFMQCKVENGECIVYDIGYRLTGSLEYKILKEVCGYDPLEMLINFALTGRMSENGIRNAVKPEFSRYAFNISFLVKPGQIAQINGLENVLKIPQVIDSVIAHYPGEEITESMKGLLAQIAIRVLGTANSFEELKQTILRIQETVSILSNEGENMVLPGFDLDDFRDIEVEVINLK